MTSQNITATPARPGPSVSTASAAVGPYGVPVYRLERAWTVREIAEFMQLGATTTRHLLAADDAPQPLRSGRTRRYNALQILAWSHGDDWRGVGAAFDGSNGLSNARTGDSSEAQVRSEQGVLTCGRRAVCSGRDAQAQRATQHVLVAADAVARRRQKDRLTALLRSADESFDMPADGRGL